MGNKSPMKREKKKKPAEKTKAVPISIAALEKAPVHNTFKDAKK